MSKQTSPLDALRDLVLVQTHMEDAAKGGFPYPAGVWPDAMKTAMTQAREVIAKADANLLDAVPDKA